jgi:hypothetical protein
VAVPGATGSGLTWVSSRLFRVRTQLAQDDPIRERGQVQRGIEIPVQPGTARLAGERGEVDRINVPVLRKNERSEPSVS